MILFLYGQDTFRSRQQLHKMMDKFRADRDPSGMNVVRLNCDKADEAARVMSETLTIPFLAERRMVVVENLLVCKQADVRKALEDRIEDAGLPESTVLLLWEGTDAFKTKDAKSLYSRLLKEKYTQVFDLLSGSALSRWILSEVAARGATIDRQAVAFLSAHVGADTWRLSTLFEQMIALVSIPNGREIGVSHVRLFVDETADDNIFNLVDAIVAKQPKLAFSLIQEQYRRGKESGYLYAMIVRQFRMMLELRDLFDREDTLTSDEMARHIGAHPFAVKKSLSSVRRYSMDELRSAYDRLLRIDAATKTSGGSQKVLLDVFVGTLCIA